MSGQLVGEVIGAFDALKARGVSARGFQALIAIAEKASTEDRTASVRWDHIRAGLFGASKRTAERAVDSLRTSGVVDVVSIGFKNQHGASRAPVYRIAPLVDTDSQMAESNTEDHDTQVSSSRQLDTDRSGLDTDKYELDTDTQVSYLTFPYDGSVDGGTREPATTEPNQRADTPPTPSEEHLDRSTAATATRPPSPYCADHPRGTPKGCNACGDARRAREAWDQEQAAHIDAERAAIRAEINACPECDQNGLTEPEEGPTRRCTQHRQLADLPTIRRAS
ncbi:hypothetical protein BHQ21_11565 [Mycobacterium sherrisii]|uniref:Helix-turn-helix domain-containing protein n=1 Tax=Mycobacterium sherrisii TaxID=243061 RepID=A0A1E3SWC3_9MYCO|nr:hypothetical protein [Mycobacterium sherrisii]ODR06420.1 hypothetical protein BHQ21_11565 [Mycobacterium sherrisii]